MDVFEAPRTITKHPSVVKVEQGVSHKYWVVLKPNAEFVFGEHEGENEAGFMTVDEFLYAIGDRIDRSVRDDAYSRAQALLTRIEGSVGKDARLTTTTQIGEIELERYRWGGTFKTRYRLNGELIARNVLYRCLVRSYRGIK